MKSRSSGMPMLEIIISIGMFTIISVFVLQLFLAANSLESKAKDTSKAVVRVESIAEAIKGSTSIEEGITLAGYSIEMVKKTESKEQDKIAYMIYLNRKWEQVEKPSYYTIDINCVQDEQENGTLVSADISLQKDKPYGFIRVDKTKELCQISMKSFK